VLTGVDNIITGAGQLDAGRMTLANAGTLAATGIGGLVILSALLNTGSLWANGGKIVVQGDATGARFAASSAPNPRQFAR